MAGPTGTKTKDNSNQKLAMSVIVYCKIDVMQRFMKYQVSETLYAS